MDGVKSQVIKYQYISTLWWRKWIKDCKKMDGIKSQTHIQLSIIIKTIRNISKK